MGAIYARHAPEGTALSRHRTAMLDAATSASASDSETSVVGPVSPAGPPAAGPRSARKKKKRGLFHRTGVVVPALVMAVLLVVGVLVAAKMVNKNGTGASGLF